MHIVEYAVVFGGGIFACRALTGYFVQAKAEAAKLTAEAHVEYTEYVLRLHAALANGKRNTLYAAIAVALIAFGLFLGK